MFKVINKDTRTTCAGVFTVNFEHISYLVLVCLLFIDFLLRSAKNTREDPNVTHFAR